jgi:hypothetical protein
MGETCMGKAPLIPRVMENAAVGIAAGEASGRLAERLGIGRRTLVRWNKRDDFRRRVTELRSQMTRAACGRLAEAMTEASEVLSSLMRGDDERVKISAARDVLRIGTKLRETVEIEERIQVLEEKTANDPS